MNHQILPYKFIPRDYQQDTFKAFFKDGYKRFIDIEHRRAGKDKKWLNIMIAASQQRVGTYLHAFPKLNQARKVIWKGIDSTDFRFLDHFPPELVAHVDNTEMAIEFKNGSIYRLAGSDSFDTWMGTNPVGIVFSEYSLQDPYAWDYFRPILVENNGWVSFIYTPRGKNHGYELYEQNKKNKEWFVQFLTINDTKLPNGNPVVTKEMIEEERHAGMPEEMVEQEFYCSFTSALGEAYYSNEMKKADNEKRILDFALEPSLPVYTFWDLGVNDSTFIWFMQTVGKEIRFVHCYENQGEGIPHYVNYLHDWKTKNGVVFAKHYAPHDINVRELGSGKTRFETARALGLQFEMPPNKPRNPEETLEQIHVVRMTLQNCWFHETNCARGIRCLKEYSKTWDDKNKIYRNAPKHDWTSHGADAFRTFAMTWNMRAPDNLRVYHNRVNTGSIF